MNLKVKKWGNQWVVLKGKKVVAECSSKSDADLLASAPDLLQAVEEAIRCHDSGFCVLDDATIAALRASRAKTIGVVSAPNKQA